MSYLGVHSTSANKDASARISATLGVVLALGAGACTGASEAPKITAVEVERVRPDGARDILEVDQPKVIACWERAEKVPVDRVAKAALKEGEYELSFSGAEPVTVTLFNRTHASAGEDFYASDCLYDLVGEPAAG